MNHFIQYSIVRNIVMLFVVSLLLHSCNSISSLVYGQGYTNRTKNTLSKTIEMVDSTGTRSVVIVPMIHIGAEKDYEKIGVYLDGLRSRGYSVYYEGVRLPESSDSCYLDSLQRKFRKMLGFDIQYQYPRLARRHKGWVSQASTKVWLSSLSENDRNIDLTTDQLIEEYEKRKAPIVLDDFDMQCPLGSKDYKIHRGAKGYSWMIAGQISPRDSLLEEHVVNDDCDKIVVVYGSYHCHILKNALLYLHGYSIK